MKNFYDNLSIEWRDYCKRKLIEEKSYIDLSDMHGMALSQPIYSQIHGETIESHGITLSYIFPLLKEGELKCRYIVSREISPLKYEYFDAIHFETAEDAIDHIKSTWNTSKDASELNRIELSFHFTLPENEW